jgi:hypothetical protein
MPITKKDLFDELSVHGRWWLPGSREQVYGTLTMSSDRIKLETDRQFEVSERFDLGYSNTVFKAPVILGETVELERCTILRAFSTLNSPAGLTLLVNALIVGRHIDTEADLMIEKAVINFAYLEEWAGCQLVNSSENADNLTLVVPNTTKELFRVEDIPPLQSAVLCSGVSRQHKLRNTILSNESQIRLEFATETNLSIVHQSIRRIGDWLSLLIGEATYPRKVTLFSRPNSGQPEHQLSYFFPIRANPPKEVFPSEMTLPLMDIGGPTAETLLKNWLLKDETLRPVIDLLVGTIYNPYQYVHTVFLSLAQALESFHRRLSDGLYVSPDEYGAVQGRLVAAIPEDVRPELKNKLAEMLKWGNEFSLRTRLKQLMAGLNQEDLRHLTNGASNKDFVELVVDIRNYLTHYNVSSKPSIVENTTEMYNLNRRLRAILTLLLLTNLGVSEHIASLAVRSNLNLAE